MVLGVPILKHFRVLQFWYQLIISEMNLTPLEMDCSIRSEIDQFSRLKRVKTMLLLNSSARKQRTKFTSANFQKNVKSKLYHIETSKTREGKQCRFR